MKYLITLIAVALLSAVALISPHKVESHGSGPPFLKINGKYAQTSPFFLGATNYKLLIPQDASPENYLVNTPIIFEIDTELLALGYNKAETATYRWSWGSEDTALSEGSKTSHTYSKTGSYLVSVEVKGREDSKFTLLNTVLVHIVPNLNYKVPEVEILTKNNNLSTKEPLKFKTKVSTDRSTGISGYEWRLTESNYDTRPEPEYHYQEQDFVHYAFVQVKDRNNIIGTAGIAIESTGGNIEIRDLDKKTKTSTNSINSFINSIYPYTPVIILALIIILVFVIRRKNRQES